MGWTGLYSVRFRQKYMWPEVHFCALTWNNKKNWDWPGLRGSKGEVKPHLVSSLAKVAEIPTWEGGKRKKNRLDKEQPMDQAERERDTSRDYLWASSSSLTALSTAFKLLFSSFSTRVANLWSTRATLNISTVSLGATWRAFFKRHIKRTILQNWSEG